MPGPVSQDHPGATPRLYPISELKEVQARWRLQRVHVVWLGPFGFTIAHTDPERAEAERDGPALDQCSLHQWLTQVYGVGTSPSVFGIFVATPSKGERPWSFTKLDAVER